MLYFGRVGSSWGHRAFFDSSWGEKVITPKFILLGVRNKVKERFSLLDVSYNNTQVSEIWVY
jgi:hypothetical protein